MWVQVINGLNAHQIRESTPCFKSSMKKFPLVLQRLSVFKKIPLYHSNFLRLQAEPEIISHRHYGFITMPQTEKSHTNQHTHPNMLYSVVLHNQDPLSKIWNREDRNHPSALLKRGTRFNTPQSQSTPDAQVWTPYPCPQLYTRSVSNYHSVPTDTQL